jgi:hypothetical protein
MSLAPLLVGENPAYLMPRASNSLGISFSRYVLPVPALPSMCIDVPLEWWSNLEFRIQVLKNSGLFFMIGSVVEHANSGISNPQI